MAAPLDHTDSNLLMYWNFDDAYGASSTSNLAGGANKAEMDILLGSSPIGGNIKAPDAGTADPTVGNKVCRSVTDGPLMFCDAALKPTIVGSTAPITGTGGDIVAAAVVGGSAVEIQLVGADSSDAAATITFTSGTPSEGAAVDGVGGLVTYTPKAKASTWTSTNTTFDTFTYTVASSGGGPPATGSVRVIYAPPPVANDVDVSIVEDVSGLIVLAPFDTIGLDVSVTIKTLPTGATLQYLDGAGNLVKDLATSDLPFSNGGNSLRFKIVPDNDQAATQSFTYSATNSAGVTSAADGVVTIEIFLANDMSSAVDQEAELTTVNVGMDLAVASVDPDSRVTIIVESLPVQGELYYVSDKSTGLVSIFDPFTSPPVTDQYAADVLEMSTFWPDGDKKWHPDQVTGAPDAAKNWGDSTKSLAYYCRAGCGMVTDYSLTNGPAEGSAEYSADLGPNGVGKGNFNNFDPVNGVKRQLHADDGWNAKAAHALWGYSEFFTVKFAEKIFIKDLEYGENRGMGSVIAIEAWDYETSTWAVIWSGPIDPAKESFFKSTNQYATTVPYPLCQPSFKTDIIKFKVDTIGIDDWNEIDYVEVTGAADAQPGLLTTSNLFYEPPLNLDCIDTFEFSTTDCGGDMKRTSPAQTYSVKPQGYAGSTVCEPKAQTAILNMGFLHPIFKESLAYDAGGHNRMVGSLMALREINDKSSTNPLLPGILPDTIIKFEFMDSKSSSAVALSQALAQGNDAFDGEGAHVVVGPASSGPSMNAQLVLKMLGIPQMSYSASSPDLSDAAEYPTFFRTSASDAFQGKAVAQFLFEDLEYKNVCIINALDGYSAKGAQAFELAALDIGITIHAKPTVTENPTIKETREALELIKNAECRVIFAMTQAAAGGTITKEAVAKDMMGADSGYLWVLADAISGNFDAVAAVAEVDSSEVFTTDDEAETETTYESPAIVLADAWVGTVGSVSLKPEGTKAHIEFMERYRAQASTVGSCGASPADVTDSCTCATDTDDFDNKLFERDHDEDAGTASKCVGYDYADADHMPNSYTYLAYDAVYAFAKAAHYMIEDGQTSFIGGAYVDALKSMDSFEGVTGTVKFESNGDREVGVGFTISNYRSVGGFVTVGNWQKDTGLTFATGETATTIVYATADGLPPPDVVLPRCTNADIILTVAKCKSDSTRLATFSIAVDANNEAVCSGGETPQPESTVTCEYSPADSGAGVLASLLGIVGCGICMVFMVWVILNTSNKVIKVAQPVFCISFAFAAGIVSLSNVFFVGENSDINCVLRPFIFNVFFDIMFGSLFLKTFRVYKIFGNKSLSKVKVSSFDVFKTYGAVISVDLVLLIIWKTTEGMKQVDVVNTMYGNWEYTTQECNSADVWSFATTFFKILMVVAGVYLSYITRNVPDKFAESKWIAMSIYQVALLGIVGLLVQSSAPDSLLLVQAICVPVACVMTCALVFVPKWLMIKNPQAYEDNLKTSQNTSSGSVSSSGGTHTDAEYNELLSKIQELQKKNTKLLEGAQ